MTLTSALTAQNLTDIRSGIYQAMQVVLRVPQTVVVQFQPSAAPSTTVFAQITVGTVVSGSMSNIEEGQLVIFSSTSDYQASDSFHTRVRKVNGTTELYVGENSQTLTTGDYITVLDMYEVQEKLRKSVTLIDWDITFRKLRPIETALQSAYVFFNGNVTFNETASPIVMDADASSISTHSWSSSNSNDTLDSGGTTATPTFTLEADSFRWLRYTFTDDLGLSNFRVIPVWTIGKTYGNTSIIPVDDGSGTTADISFDAELGRTCNFTAYDDADQLINRNMIVVASDEWYGGRTNADRQSIRTNINFIGYLQSENANQQVNDANGRITDVAFIAEGFGHQLARQNISEVTIIQTNGSAVAWDEIQDPTPGRMLTYRLTEYSTASTLMAVGIPSDDANFIGDDLTLDSGKLLDDLRFIGDGYNAEIQFDVTGIIDMCRDLNFLGTSARDAAPVVGTLTPADFTDSYSIEYEYGFATSQVTITSGSYQTASDDYELFEAISPAEARYAEGDSFVLSNQVLTTDNSGSSSITEVSQRAANFLAFNNPTWVLRANMPDAWLSVLAPDVGAWFKFTITATDTERGKVFGSSDRWQLVQVNYSSNSRDGIRRGDCIWRYETESTGASVRAATIVNDPFADIAYLPAVDEPYLGTDLDDTGGDWYDSKDPQPPDEPDPQSADCESFNVRNSASGSTNQTTNSALNGEQITVEVRGSGAIGAGTGSTFDWDADPSEWSPPSGWSLSHDGTFGDGPGNFDGYYEHIGGSETNTATLTMTFTLPGVHVTSLFVRAANNSPSNGTGTITCDAGSFSQTEDLPDVGFGSFTFNIDERVSTITLSLTTTQPFAGLAVDKFIFTIDTFGDAFYEFDSENEVVSAFSTGFGLQVEGGDVTSIPPYNPNHEYSFVETVTSGPVDFSYSTTHAYGDGDPFPLQLVVCFNGVP